MTNEQNIQNNKALIDRYPFLLPRDRWTGKVLDGYDYSYTELDDMPYGWRVAFAEKLCEEIREELLQFGEEYLEKYQILQIKEKFGSLCWYDIGTTSTDKIIKEIIPKYAEISKHTCIECGKPATQISQFWICPYCDDCATTIRDVFVDVDEWFKDELASLLKRQFKFGRDVDKSFRTSRMECAIFKDVQAYNANSDRKLEAIIENGRVCIYTDGHLQASSLTIKEAHFMIMGMLVEQMCSRREHNDLS